MVLNPIAGPDQRPVHRPARAAPALPAARRPAARARLRAALRRPPTSARRPSTRAWVLVMFVACATAYAFFQVPYVAMPAEITDSYDERTRLMTWRVAILAFAIMLSGATRARPIRDAVRWPGRLPRDGSGGRGAAGGRRRRRLRRHPVGAGRPGRARHRDAARAAARSWPRARDFRLLLATFVLQALAIGAMLAGVAYVSRWVLGRQGRGHDPVRLLRRAGAAADPGVERARPSGSARSAATSPPRSCWRSRRVLLVGRPVEPRLVGVRRDRAGRASGTPAPRSSRWRCSPTPRRSTPGARVRTGRASTPASGRPARPSASRSGRRSTRCVLAVGGYVSTDQPADWLTQLPARLARSPRSCSASRCCRPC